MVTQLIGSAVKRKEDPRMITGRGRYVDDVQPLNLHYVAFLRSPHAHARIRGIDTSKAAALPGVVKVYTGKDFEGKIGSLPCGVNLPNSNQKTPNHPAMAVDRVRYVGEIVAAVVAKDRATAKDALELIEVHYEPLPAVADARKAVQPGAPLVHDDIENNTAFVWNLQTGEVEQAFRDAEVVVRQELVNQRLIPNAMEPRAVVANFDTASGELTLWDTDQNPHLIRLLLCLITGLPEHKVRVIAPDVGGGFGSKIYLYAEQPLLALMSKELGLPLKWTEERRENYVGTTHGRDHYTTAEMAFKRDGTLLGLRVETYANLGAYLSTFGPLIPTFLYGPLLSGVYKLPALSVRTYGVLTHTTPVDAYRGAGRPEACYLVERMMDLAALELGMDPAEIRRKNFIPATAFPVTTAGTLTYDSGNYEANLDAALEKFGYRSWREEQERARAQGRYIGIGLACYVEACGIGPSKAAGQMGAGAGLWESGVVRVHPTGKVSVFTGTSPHGQGGETALAQIAADTLGVPFEDVEVIHGDTASIPFGLGTYGSRTIAVGGTAVYLSCLKVIEKGKKIAAHLLEAAESDIEFEGGKFYVKGTPEKAVTFQGVALQAFLAHNYPPGLEPGLEALTFFDPPNLTFPAGTYMAVTEVDAETGKVDLLAFYAMDDCGRVINPLLAAGQVHGGVAQGIAQALWEEAVYDDSAQLLTGSMMDYAVPKASQLPPFVTDHTVTPTPTNPLGAKGIGEAGTIGATPAVVNAVMDALKPFGIRHIDMPLKPEKVWRAIQAAKQAGR